MSSNFDIQRILDAKEIVCPSIILSFHYGKEKSFGILVIDYIRTAYKLKSEVIKDYIENGNKSDTVRGYGNLIDLDLENKDLIVKYYYDVSSYLYDPEKCAPVASIPSCYKYIDPKQNGRLVEILNKFANYQDSLEVEYTAMEDLAEDRNDGLFKREEFTPPNQVMDILMRNDNLVNFSDVCYKSDYFNKKYF